MSDGRAVERPSVVIYRHPGASPAVLHEVCAGAEEEGVPTRVEPVGDTDGRDAPALAHPAALDSRLEVGVGIGAYREEFLALQPGTKMDRGDIVDPRHLDR